MKTVTFKSWNAQKEAYERPLIETVARDMNELGYVFAWNVENSYNYLVLQRRPRCWGVADFKNPEGNKAFGRKMLSTMAALASDEHFPAEEVFEDLPAQELNLERERQLVDAAVRKHGGTSDDLFIDVGQSLIRGGNGGNCGVGMTPCVTPGHRVFSTKRKRLLTAADHMRLQAIWGEDMDEQGSKAMCVL